MKKVKWTNKGRNVWSINKFNKMQSHGFHTIVLQLSVHNKATGFRMMIKREFDTSVRIPDFFKEEQSLKAELESNPDFVAAGRQDEEG